MTGEETADVKRERPPLTTDILKKVVEKLVKVPVENLVGEENQGFRQRSQAALEGPDQLRSPTDFRIISTEIQRV